MKRGFVFVLAFGLLLSLPAQKVDYSGYRVLRVWTYSQAQLERLLPMVQDVWSEGIGVGPLDVCVSPKGFQAIRQAGFPFRVLIEDVGALIRQQQSEFYPQGSGLFDRYLPYDEVVGVLQNLAQTYPRIAQLFIVGQSLEGRPIYGLRITKNVQQQSNYPDRADVVVNGCQHAREWITVSTALYVAYQLVTQFGINTEITRLVRKTEIYVIPIVNPDGYVYTWTTNRLWRKNRRYNGIVNGQPSYGVDLNRNWSYQWGNVGSSGDPNSEIYRGTAPFSEPETTVVSQWMQSLPDLKAHMDYHNYSQLILWPWGWTNALPPDQSTFLEVGTRMENRIEAVHGKNYTPGPIYTTIYPASGNMVDWAYGTLNALSFTIELRDRGQYGFLLPPEQILPTCEENLPGILYLIRWAKRNF